MNTVLFILIYIFALIGYIGTGLILYVNFDDYQFNKLAYFFNEFLKKIFQKTNKDYCEWIDGELWYKSCNWYNGVPNIQNNIYYDSDVWNSNYQPFLSIFELLCLVFWPLWILINLIIGAFYDD